MGFRQLLALGSAVAVLLALGGSVASAKGSGEARLDQAIPGDAAPGSVVTVSWRLFAPHDEGWGPTALGVFLRLKGPGGESEEAYGTEYWPGHFFADVTVPAGGIAGVEIGIAGQACAAGRCERSDWLFPITGIGPRAGVPIEEIYQPRVDPLFGPISAASPIRVRIVFWRRPGVPEGMTALPARVFIRSTDLATGRIVDVFALPDQPYHFLATVTYPTPGRHSLEAAVGDADGVDRAFEGSLVHLQVGDTAPTTPRSDADRDAVPIVPRAPLWILGLTGALGLAIVALRFPGRIARRRPTDRTG